ncbi:Universal stress protein family [hydrothermal vent metagenome]|uniref:Universal stress protein family n=1 Tax=hydrothermal vent metagenome TaxID=652676 RepID=A0A3B0WAP2_9ZZZZ
MVNYQRILITTDFSEQSICALKRAQVMAEQWQAKLELLHVVDIPIYPVLEDVAIMGMPSLWDEDLAKTLLETSEKRLSGIAKQHGVADFMTISGNPSDEIITIAKVNKVDLIVMGFHGLSGFKKLIGSTTHSVINDAPCDVLAVKQEVKK